MGFWSGFAEGVKGAATGTWEGVKSLAKGGYDLATDPAARERAWESTKSAANSVTDYASKVYDDPAKAYRDAKDGVNAAYTAAENFVETADAEDWGKLAGAGAFEVGTALIPVGALAKAGKLGKLAKGAKALDKVEDVADAATDAAKAAKKLKKAKPRSVEKCPKKKKTKGEQLAENKKKGDAFEEEVLADVKKTDVVAEQQITVVTKEGTKTRLDIASKDSSDKIKLTEAKSSETAPLTKNQKKAFPEIESGGATVVGKGKPGFPGGTKIPPTKVDIVRPKPKN